MNINITSMKKRDLWRLRAYLNLLESLPDLYTRATIHTRIENRNGRHQRKLTLHLSMEDFGADDMVFMSPSHFKAVLREEVDRESVKQARVLGMLNTNEV